MPDEIRRRLAEKMASFENPCVLWSGGADSTLVLALAREIKPDIDVCQFRIDMSPYQKRFVDRVAAEWKLQVFSWSPAMRFFVPYKDTYALADIYAWGHSHIPAVRELLDAESPCALDLSTQRTPALDERYDLLLMGILGTDSEYGHAIATEGRVGTSEFYSPLGDMTKDDVLGTMRSLNLPLDERVRDGDEYADTGMIGCCHRCLKKGTGPVFCPKAQRDIPRIDWNEDDNQALLMRFLGH